MIIDNKKIEVIKEKQKLKKENEQLKGKIEYLNETLDALVLENLGGNE